MNEGVGKAGFSPTLLWVQGRITWPYTPSTLTLLKPPIELFDIRHRPGDGSWSYTYLKRKGTSRVPVVSTRCFPFCHSADQLIYHD
jgi:hypothetical protein